MASNSFFLNRAVARNADWQVNYPALAMASTIDAVDERRKQIVVAATDQTSLRAVFFSSLGAILDFHATWDELERSGKGWLAFTIRWNRWWLPNVAHVASLERHAFAPTDLRFANRDLGVAPGDTGPFENFSMPLNFTIVATLPSPACCFRPTPAQPSISRASIRPGVIYNCVDAQGHSVRKASRRH
jgi:hypothetical protein